MQGKKCGHQTIKAIARGARNIHSPQQNVWYEALDNEGAIQEAVNWVLGNENIFLNTVGDIYLK